MSIGPGQSAGQFFFSCGITFGDCFIIYFCLPNERGFLFLVHLLVIIAYTAVVFGLDTAHLVVIDGCC